MSIGIIGAGHAGLTLFARLQEIGEQPSIYSHEQHSALVAGVLNSGGWIDLENVPLNTKYRAKINRADVTHCVDDLLKESDLIFNTTPIDAHAELFTSVLNAVSNGARGKAYVNLGGGFSIFEHISRVREKNLALDLGTFHTLPFAARCVGANATLLNIRAETSYAFYGRHREDCVSLLQRLFPSKLVRDDNILHMSLDRSSYVMHPLILIFNANRIDRGERFYFYTDGFSPSIKSLLLRAAHERIALAEKLGFFDYPDPLTRLANFERNYSEDFKYIRPPSSLKHRYILEDIPYGLVPICGLGETYGVAMPVCNALVDVASAVSGVNFWDSPYNLRCNPILLASYLLGQRTPMRVERHTYSRTGVSA